MSINAAKLVRFQHDQELRDAVETCELVTADGQAVVWAARVLGRPLPERVAGIAPSEEPEVVEGIAGAKPDVLFVALETPFKELFLARNRDRLQIPFVMGVGGAVDILGGVRRRAPGWMQRLGLEWAYRLAQDPRRLARRYIVGNTWFTWLVARELVRQRVLPSSAARGRDAA
ncbi:MAG: hypothetical protein AUI15_22095 [Actinobacteria bacterium 13_2_20CM_2_66_6]|nr:MAG: hypothetical protein AUI15_22095 [Actinobacteria bacterium 13_2_20CM_2_66_6]